jgi:hypothetical protein
VTLGEIEHASPDGIADVVLFTIEEAHTYIAGGVLSHNKIQP